MLSGSESLEFSQSASISTVLQVPGQPHVSWTFNRGDPYCYKHVGVSLNHLLIYWED